jgi:hypothetical protein
MVYTKRRATMLILLKKLCSFISFRASVSRGLDDYIASKNPQTVAEAEYLAQKYLNRGECGRTM